MQGCSPFVRENLVGEYGKNRRILKIGQSQGEFVRRNEAGSRFPGERSKINTLSQSPFWSGMTLNGDKNYNEQEI